MKRQLHQLNRILIGRSGETFTDPEPCYLFEYETRAGHKVGHLEGGMSPLGDTFYLFHIGVLAEYRRQYYGLSMLADICRAYKAPITVIHGTNEAFWSRVESAGENLVKLRMPVKLNEMSKIREQWRTSV